jgi:hypothetical protein
MAEDPAGMLQLQQRMPVTQMSKLYSEDFPNGFQRDMKWKNSIGKQGSPLK